MTGWSFCLVAVALPTGGLPFALNIKNLPDAFWGQAISASAHCDHCGSAGLWYLSSSDHLWDWNVLVRHLSVFNFGA